MKIYDKPANLNGAELKQKQQELELREARIIKIEASQKILNSELVEKINKLSVKHKRIRNFNFKNSNSLYWPTSIRS